MSTYLDVFAADEVLWGLLAQGLVSWSTVLTVGGVDPVEAIHRELVAVQVKHGAIAIVTEPI